MDMVQHVVLQGGLTRAQLAPGDLAVAVVVQADRELAIANREFEYAGNLRALDLQAQESVAGDVGLSEWDCQQQRQRPQRLSQRAHRAAIAAVVEGIVRASRKLWVRAKSS